MRYKDKKEFLGAINNDSQIKPLISSGYIKEIDKKDLSLYNLKPRADGLYSYSQIFDLSTILRKKIKKEHGEKALIKIGGTRTVKDKYFNEFNIIKSIFPECSISQRFLIATLSEKFNEELDQIRNRYSIPNGGFNLHNKDSDKLYKKWEDKMRSLAVKELENKTRADYILENRLTGYVFGEPGAYSDNIFTSLGKLKDETYKLFWKYKIQLGFVPHFYIRFGLTYNEIAHFLNELNKTTPFQISTRWQFESEFLLWVTPKYGFPNFYLTPVLLKVVLKN